MAKIPCSYPSLAASTSLSRLLLILGCILSCCEGRDFAESGTVTQKCPNKGTDEATTYPKCDTLAKEHDAKDQKAPPELLNMLTECVTEVAERASCLEERAQASATANQNYKEKFEKIHDKLSELQDSKIQTELHIAHDKAYQAAQKKVEEIKDTIENFMNVGDDKDFDNGCQQKGQVPKPGGKPGECETQAAATKEVSAEIQQGTVTPGGTGI